VQGHNGKPRGFTAQSNTQVALICTVLAACILIVDIASLPLGVAAGVAYVAVVIVSLWLSHWKLSFLVAGAVSVLTLLGFLYSEPSGTAWMVIANRVLALAAIWFTAIVGGWLVFSRRKRMEAALQMAETEAYRARNAKSRFLDATSNEMRQHLQTLSLLGAALRTTLADPKAQEIFAKQDDAVANLADLLNSILEFCELESGGVSPRITEVPIQDVFQRLRHEFESPAHAKGLQLRFNSQASIVLSDSMLLKQVLRSLVSNAIRYSSHGTVDVSCHHEPGGLRISVSDNGIGIAPDELAKIFDEFYRVENNPVDRSSGRGLGLAIVNRGLELLQTRIDVKSEPGQGSSFSFVLPPAT